MIMVDSRVARDDQGKPLASPEIRSSTTCRAARTAAA
jgi:hypothetical protein